MDRQKLTHNNKFFNRIWAILLSYSRVLLALIFCLSSILSLFAFTTIQVQRTFSPQMLGENIRYIASSPDTFSLQNIMSLPDSAFKVYDRNNFIFGLSHSAHWLKFDLLNKDQSDLDKVLIFEVVHPYINELHFYQTQNGQLQQHDSLGINFAFEQRSSKDGLIHRNFHFQIQMLKGDSLSCYLHILPNTYPLNFTLFLWEKEERIVKQQRFEDGVLAVYFILSAVFLLMLGIVLPIIRISYFWYYFVYVLLGILFTFSDLGLGYLYLWPTTPYIQQIASAVLSILYLLAGTQFVRRHFETADFFPKYDILLRTISIAATVFLVLSFFLPSYPIDFSHSMFFLYYILLIVVCAILISLFILSFFRDKKPFPGLFLLAFSIHGIAVVISSLQYIRLLPDVSITEILLNNGIPLTFYTPIINMLGMLLEIIIIFYIAVKLFRAVYERNLLMVKELAEQKEKNANALLMGMETERRRIAKDLHDGIGVQLSVIKNKVHLLKDKPSPQQLDFDLVIQDLKKTYKDVRAISHNLTTETFGRLGFLAAIEESIQKLRAFDDNLHIQFYNNVDFDPIDDFVKVQLYRIVQELLQNILKHAAAAEVSLQFIQHDEYFTLSIEDDGEGFDKDKLMGNGIGLQNIQNRVAALNGCLSIESGKGKGTFISMDIPIANQQNKQEEEKRQSKVIVLPSWLGF